MHFVALMQAKASPIEPGNGLGAHFPHLTINVMIRQAPDS